MKNGWYDEFGYLKHYVNDKTHNENGPARIYDSGTKFWYQNDKFHRLDGPAYESHYEIKEWYYQGKFIKCKSQQEFDRIIKLKLLW